MRDQKKRRIGNAARAFTLVELLVVIGIIALLIGLIVPGVSKVRIASQKVATQNTLNRLSMGIEAYFLEFNGYPGPFADDQLVSADMSGTTPTPELVPGGGQRLQLMTPGSPASYSQLGHAPTTSENLFLGLCGGLRFDPSKSAAQQFIYDPELARRARGPQSLNQNTAKRSQTYLEITDADISATDDTKNPIASDMALPSEWWGGTGKGPALSSNFLGDSAIYEFVDRFSKPKPILYMRAKRGASRDSSNATTVLSGFLFDWTKPATSANPTYPYQYRLDQLQYSYANFIDRDKMDMAGKPWTVDKVDFPNVMDDVTPTKVKFNAGEEHYFVNESASTGNATSMSDTTKTLVPAMKDKFILISAGPDGLYGTADDIRNY